MKTKFIVLSVIQLVLCLEAFAGLASVKAKKSYMTGFVSKESAQVLRLDTGRTVYRLHSRSVTKRNPLIQRHIASKRQVTVVVEAKDVMGIDVTAAVSGEQK